MRIKYAFFDVIISSLAVICVMQLKNGGTIFIYKNYINIGKF